MAVHLFQQFIRAALHRQVQVLAQVGLGRNGVDQFMAGILRVAGHKADLVIAGHSAEQIEQISKVHLFLQALAVAVHVLAEQGDFLHPVGDKRRRIGGDVL